MKVQDRFIKYTTFDTTSQDFSDKVPSTENQWELAKYLEKELKDLGLSDVRLAEHCFVYGFIPASKGCEKEPAIGLCAHMDTSSSAPGCNIHPQIVKYEGGDITLLNGIKIEPKDYPFMEKLVGDHLIVSDGTTLLGVDDKAGVAEIVNCCEYLMQHPEVKHGKVCIAFTPDEEVGMGVEFFDVKGYGADFAYTLDGGLLGSLEYETFNAASARATITGFNIHPGSAKNRMKNACLIANEFINMLPASQTPATTEGYEGYFHVQTMGGDESSVYINMLIRDHDMQKFEGRKQFMRNIESYLNGKYGEGTVKIDISDTYYNMAEKIKEKMYVVDRAKQAMLALGVTPVVTPVRGGTDGSKLSYMGLPTPNLCTGGANYHGVKELVSIEQMEKCVDILVEIVKAK